MSRFAKGIDPHVDLAGAVIPRANFSRAALIEANLENANLSGADLSFAILVNSKLANAVLEGANLAGADLSGADLTKANLIRADLSNAKLVSANLSYSTLTGAILRSANLTDAQGLSWHDLLAAHLDENTIFPDNMLGDSLFQYLDGAFHDIAIGLRDESGGDLTRFIRQLNEHLQNIGNDWTIRKFLIEMQLHESNSEENQIHNRLFDD